MYCTVTYYTYSLIYFSLVFQHLLHPSLNSTEIATRKRWKETSSTARLRVRVGLSCNAGPGVIPASADEPETFADFLCFQLLKTHFGKPGSAPSQRLLCIHVNFTEAMVTCLILTWLFLSNRIRHSTTRSIHHSHSPVYGVRSSTCGLFRSGRIYHTFTVGEAVPVGSLMRLGGSIRL